MHRASFPGKRTCWICLHAEDGDLGPNSFDSLSAVEFASSLGRQLKLDLPSTLLFDYPSIGSMAQYIHSQLAPPSSASAAGMVLSADDIASRGGPGLRDQRQPISIALAGRLPTGAASGIDLAKGADGICRVPFERWDLEAAQVLP